MIARIYHGYTKPEHGEAYEAMLKPERLPGISKANGYRGSYLLRRKAGNEVVHHSYALGLDERDSHRRRQQGLRDCGDPR